MVTQKQLQGLAKGRAVRKRNLLMKKQYSKQKVQSRNRFVRVPRNVSIINPQLLINPDLDVTRVDAGGMNERNSFSDLDVSRTDVMINEKISSGEGIFTNLNDVIPKVLQRRRR